MPKRRQRPLSTDDWPAGHGCLILQETDSTMREAARRAGELAAPTWVMARRQTAGTGRRGRAWHMDEGNLAATLVMRPEGGPAQAALRTFVAALALFDTLAELAPETRLSLKWPNDVLLNGGKVAGILLESGGRGGAVDWLAVGVGVNLVSAPAAEVVEPGAVTPVALADTAGAPDPEDVLRRLAVHFARHEAQFRDHGFAPLRRLWLSRAARLGEAITARMGEETATGTFDTVDEEGSLVLRTEAGPRIIAAADIQFGGGA